MRALWILGLCVLTSLFGKDFGNGANTFPIEEKNPLESLESKAALHESEMRKYEEEITKYIENPFPIEGIGKAFERRSRLLDPTLTVEEDIEVDGKLLARAGTKVNPLEKIDLPGGLLFFDGTDPSQIAWARKEPPDFKWILVTGSPIALETQENRAVYFDQLGLFTAKFGIQNVPTKITQKGSLFLIEEIPVEGNP